MSGLKNKETDLKIVKNTNVEKSDKVSKDAKKKMQNNTEDNNKEISKSQSKLIIKIPKPFALGYIIIDLSTMLGNLVKGLAAAVIALLLAKIANILTDLLAKTFNKGDVSQNDIDSALNETDMNSLITESIHDYNTLSLYNLNSSLDANVSDKIITDEYIKVNNKKKKTSQVKYSIDKRNRKDILDSSIVNEREGSNNKNIKTVKNQNYGIYLD